MNLLIYAQDISKSFQGRTVIDHVTLEIGHRKIVTIVGPNGSGKTTLLKLLLGLEEPDSGAVGRSRSTRIGYMPQRMRIDPILPITVEWFLKLYAKGASIIPIAEEVGISHLLQSPLQQLSGGETQRVMLARALLCEPELLVLDEPVQGVDVSGQAEMYGLIARAARARSAAVVMVSHDLHLVMSATDEVICLNHHICCAGHPHQVRGDPAFSALFGPHVAESLAVYTHHHDHEHVH